MWVLLIDFQLLEGGRFSSFPYVFFPCITTNTIYIYVLQLTFRHMFPNLNEFW